MVGWVDWGRFIKTTTILSLPLSSLLLLIFFFVFLFYCVFFYFLFYCVFLPLDGLPPFTYMKMLPCLCCMGIGKIFHVSATRCIQVWIMPSTRLLFLCPAPSRCLNLFSLHEDIGLFGCVENGKIFHLVHDAFKVGSYNTPSHSTSQVCLHS